MQQRLFECRCSRLVCSSVHGRPRTDGFEIPSDPTTRSVCANRESVGCAKLAQSPDFAIPGMSAWIKSRRQTRHLYSIDQSLPRRRCCEQVAVRCRGQADRPANVRLFLIDDGARPDIPGAGFARRVEYRSLSQKNVTPASGATSLNWIRLGTGIRRERFRPVEGSLSRPLEASLLGVRNQSVHK